MGSPVHMKYEAGSAKSIEESEIEWFIDRFIGIPIYAREVKKAIDLDPICKSDNHWSISQWFVTNLTLCGFLLPFYFWENISDPSLF